MHCPIYTTQLVRQGRSQYRRRSVTNTDTGVDTVLQVSRPILEDSPQEKFCILTLDTKLKVIGFHIVSHGTLDAALVHPREVFQHAILAAANSIILVHNHPSGDLRPSQGDHDVTARMKEAGKQLGITVLDHIVVGHDDEHWRGVSLAEWGSLGEKAIRTLP